MRLAYSLHWALKKDVRKDITDDVLEYAILHSSKLKDKHWPDASNAICRVPPMGRLVKVVYKKTGKDTIKIITSYWLE